MSDTSQGPGWWQASDGKWYPPQPGAEAPPVPPPPPPYTYPAPYPPPYDPWGNPYPGYAVGPPVRKTNGFAIASLVLSILWVFGLGSIVAVAFSFKARHDIRRSAGTQEGEGLAIAGLTLGVLGLIGVTLLVAFSLTVVRQQVQSLPVGRTVTASVGQTISMGGSLGQMISMGGSMGLTSATVNSLDYPVPASTVRAPRRRGHQFAVASVTLCAGATGAQSLPQFAAFSLNLTSGASISPSVRGRSPNVADVDNIGANRCVRGYLTFQATAAPASLSLSDFLFNTYVWRVAHGD